MYVKLELRDQNSGALSGTTTRKKRVSDMRPNKIFFFLCAKTSLQSTAGEGNGAFLVFVFVLFYSFDEVILIVKGCLVYRQL